MRSNFLTDLILASFKGWKMLLKAGLLKETLTTTISSKLTVGKTNYLEKIMPATTGPESIGSKQPRTLPDIGEALKLALRAIKVLPMRVTPVMTARETAAVLPFATALSASMSR